MADARFKYNRGHIKRQPLLLLQPRSVTNDIDLSLEDPDLCSIFFVFEDVPDPANRVTPIFTIPGSSDPIILGDPVEGPNVTQLYVLGHGQVVPDGLIGKITGQTEGPGMGLMVDYDLDVTAFDQLKAVGVTGHFLLTPSVFNLQMLHDGTVPVTYSAFITVGDLGD